VWERDGPETKFGPNDLRQLPIKSDALPVEWELRTNLGPIHITPLNVTKDGLPNKGQWAPAQNLIDYEKGE
jgi:hypothetical protein